ncbi:DNA-directed RNA polymerase I subunit RPA34.5-domain-containing protein [Aspergillus cavernicola]|uniref:DNA-directed RNA polymerase I subunit RPA34.5-domain-containing protein n=1 Tax=Aspergillus cavernicola TaxID=176166 RepID=A0ABR4HN04_9EURO
MAPKSDKEIEPHAARSESESSSSAESNRKAEESSSSSSDAESDSSVSESEKEPASKKESKPLTRKTDHKSQARTLRPPQPYKPPQGFKSAKNQLSSSTTSSLSDLSGKQVFHISAPASLPLSKIKEVSLAQAMKGEPILKHNGVQFGIPVDSLKHANSSAQTLLLYDSKTQTYRSTVTNVPTYHIQEMITIPGGAEFEEASVKAANSLVKPPRKQPKHLKMRFRPVGSGDGPTETLGSSSESEGEGSTFKIPKSLETKKEKKRKHQQTEGDGSQAAVVPRKKSKKHSGDIADAGEEKPKKSKD